MKKLLLLSLAALSLLIVSCSSSPKSAVDTVKAAYKCIENGDYAGFINYAKGAEMMSSEKKELNAAALKYMYSKIDDFKVISVEEISNDGDKAELKLVYKANGEVDTDTFYMVKDKNGNWKFDN